MSNHQGNTQKTPFARAINRFTEGKVLDFIQLTGKALPCHVTAVVGSIVTVKFDVTSDFTLPDVTCPMFGPQYIRYPIQTGCLGVVLPADVYLGGITGIGGGTADFSLPSNLSALVFMPVANNGALDGNNSSENWPETENADALVLYGPDGAIIRTLDKNTTLTIKRDGVLLNTDKTIGITAAEDVTLDTQKGLAVTAQEQSTVQADGETLTIGGGSIRSSGVLKAGNGTTNTVTISGHTITVHDGIVTGLT